MTRKLRTRPDAGVTLIEMTVVVAILSGVITMVTGALMMAFQTMGGNASRLEGVTQAKVAMESMTRTLRTAILPSQVNGTCTGCDTAAFITGDATSVVFYANVDSDAAAPVSGQSNAGPSRVSYSLVDGVLSETVRRPDPHSATDFNYTYTCTSGTTGCQVRTRDLAHDVAQEGSALFTYYDRNGNILAVPLQTDVNRLRAVDSIDVVLKVRTSDRVSTGTTSTRVTLPNADSLIQPTATPEP